MYIIFSVYVYNLEIFFIITLIFTFVENYE